MATAGQRPSSSKPTNPASQKGVAIPPTFTTNPSNKSSSLDLTELSHKIEKPNEKDGEYMLHARLPTFYSVTGFSLLNWLINPNRAGTVTIVDLRSAKNDAVELQWHGRFRDDIPAKVLFMPLKTDDKAVVTEELNKWMKESTEQDKTKLLKADTVIFHCSKGEQRSPVMCLKYAELSGRKAGQRIALFHHGFSNGWFNEDGWPKRNEQVSTVHKAQKKNFVVGGILNSGPKS